MSQSHLSAFTVPMPFILGETERLEALFFRFLTHCSYLRIPMCRRISSNGREPAEHAEDRRIDAYVPFWRKVDKEGTWLQFSNIWKVDMKKMENHCFRREQNTRQSV